MIKFWQWFKSLFTKSNTKSPTPITEVVPAPVPAMKNGSESSDEEGILKRNQEAQLALDVLRNATKDKKNQKEVREKLEEAKQKRRVARREGELGELYVNINVHSDPSIVKSEKTGCLPDFFRLFRRGKPATKPTQVAVVGQTPGSAKAKA